MKKSIALIFALAATSLFAAPKAASNAATKVSKAEAVKNLVDQGVQFHEQGQYDEAIAKYKEAEKKDPKNALVKYEMAFTYHAKRDLDKVYYTVLYPMMYVMRRPESSAKVRRKY